MTCVHADSLSEDANILLAEHLKNNNLPGITAAISIDNLIVWEGAAGYHDLEAKIPAEVETPHRIASITKSMTATAIMQLVENGDIKLNAPLRKYVRSYPKKTKGTVRIHHLLAHTSGTTHYRGKENRPFTHYDTLDDALSVFVDRRLAFTPGENYLYTTYGYTILGKVIESVSDLTYASYMEKHIWIPAGMTQTTLEDRNNLSPNLPKLYRKDTDGLIVRDDETDLSIKYPGGGVLSTVGDLLRFAHAYQNDTLVSKEYRDRMMLVPEVRKRRVPYGLGWMVWESEKYGNYIHNDGGQSGTSSFLVIMPEKKISVAIIC